jgi:hypothetical protein
MITDKQIDKVDVELLTREFKVLNIDTFATYLKEVWKVIGKLTQDLSQRSDDTKNKGVNKITFSKVYKL